MPGQLTKSKRFVGVYFAESKDRRDKEGKPDRRFYITYKKEGRQIVEKVGWASEGYSAQVASTIRAENVRRIRHGEDLPVEKRRSPRFSEMAEEFLKWAEENKKDKNDRGRYENYLKKSLGDKRLIEVSPIDLERIKSAMNQRGLSPGTVKHALTLVRSIFNKATSWGRFKGVNPVKMVKLPTLNNQRQRFLSHEEAQLLLDELKKGSQTIYEISLVSLLSGLRAGEIHNLRGRDLDFENMVIHVADPKNKNSRKTFMTEEVKSVLQGRIGDDPNKFVFAPRIHELDHIKRVSGFFQRTANELFNEGIEDRRQRVVFHTLRHSFGSWLAIQGTPILTIKELMGHKTLNMTLRYAHLSPSPQKDAVAALQAGFNQGRNGKEEKVNLQAVS